MKASEMTNEELSKALMSRVPLDSNNYDDIREASARLRKLKIAEDALEKCVNYNNSWELEAAKKNAKNALAAIRRKGVTNV